MSEYERGRRDGLLTVEQVKECLPCSSSTQSDDEWWNVVTANLNHALAATSGTPADANEPWFKPYASCDWCGRVTHDEREFDRKCSNEGGFMREACQGTFRVSPILEKPAAPPPADETLPAGAPSTCPRCEGTGKYQRGPLDAVTDCAICNGHGRLDENGVGLSAQPSGAQGEERSYGLVHELEREIIRLNEDLRCWQFEFRLWRGAWLRHLGGYIIRKSHEIDGFGLRHDQQITEAYERGVGDAKNAIVYRDKWIEEVGKALGSSDALAAAQTEKEKK